jgi:hypothetical protein
MAKRSKPNKIGQFLKQEFPQGVPNTRVTKLLAGGRITSEEKPVVIRKTPIMWGIPCDEVSFTEFWIRFEQHANRMPWDDFSGSKGTYLPGARNFVHNGFLDTKTSLLMMLDSDVLFPPNLVDILISHKLPIVGGWYRDKNALDHHPAVYDFVEENEKEIVWRHRTQPGTGLEKVDGMGAGCWLMRREVAEALGRNPYNMEKGGEDLALSRKLMKLGIPLYVDWSLNCAHAGVGWI